MDLGTEMERRTVVIQIGNSDDKLTQKEWSAFVYAIRLKLAATVGIVHFFGTSDGHDSWQNACWVMEVPLSKIKILKSRLSRIGKKYKQDSIAFLEGITEFI